MIPKPTTIMEAQAHIWGREVTRDPPERRVHEAPKASRANMAQKDNRVIPVHLEMYS
jgi:hypothetical protein